MEVDNRSKGVAPKLLKKGHHPGASPLYQSVYQSARLLFQSMPDALSPGTPSPFKQIRRVNDAGMIG